MAPFNRLRELRALAGYRFPDLAVSAYLPTDPGAGHNYYRALLTDLARADLHKLADRDRAALERELPILLEALLKHRFEAPTVAVFSCRPQELLQLWRLADPLPGRIAVAGRLDLAPIRLQLRHHPPTAAAVVDKREGRLFSLVLGEITDLGQLEGLPISRHKQGGWSATGYQRRQDEHTRWNLQRVARRLEAVLGPRRHTRLVVAGPPEARAELIDLLSPAARARLAAEGPIPEYATGNELTSSLFELARGS